MPITQTQFEDIVMDIILAIYASTLIPESHKQKYVDYIKTHGMTEKMLLELQKIFSEEEKSLTMSIEEKEKLVQGLQAIVADEQKIVDRPMAEIAASVDTYCEKQENNFKENLKTIEDNLSSAVEQVSSNLEKKQEEDIKKKLGLTKK